LQPTKIIIYKEIIAYMAEKFSTDRAKDEKYMRMAITEALRALDKEEVPIGAIVVAGDRIIGRGHNLVETLCDATAHAEMQAITAAMSALGGKYLNDCTLYVTVEPCVMCGGALAWSQIGRVVYGAADPKRGYSTYSERIMHPRTEVVGGVLAEECEQVMKEFFSSLRK
jgi:tRNA(adenine34) deaminase